MRFGPARPLLGRALVVLIVGSFVPSAGAAEPPDASPERILAALHADYGRYIREIRVISLQAAAVSPAAIYSGLVRPGGMDPRISADAPVPGRRSDIVLFPAATDPRRGPAWLRLILDHELFHARHLSRATEMPLVDFGSARVNSSYYEAAAWGYVLERARAGVYGEMRPGDMAEITATTRRHYAAFRRYVENVQPAAWLHYGRFILDPDGGEGRPQAQPEIRSSLPSRPASP